MSNLFRTTPPPGIGADGKVLETPLQKAQRVAEMEGRIRLREGLPFLHGWKWYVWARRFFESTNHVNLLCAANQVSKSSTNIRKCLHWATEKSLWPELWVSDPVQFWYLYPSQKVVNAEFETKWKQFLPNGEFKDDETYGWRAEKDGKDVVALHFNSGVHVYFKTYTQKSSDLQTGTCDAIFCDEELPIALFDELMFRISASNGYFHMVFTATLGQDFWRRAMEPEKSDEEVLPGAFKQTISLYDCRIYEDGSPSQWTSERIKQIEGRCSTQNEVLKRVWGRFIVVGGRKYEAFDIKRHMKPKHKLPPGWLIFGGADPGSGGEFNHAAALCYIAVRPDFRAGRVFCGWRGDGVETTSGDVVQKHIDLQVEHNFTCTDKWYDWSDKDFDIISTRMGQPFSKADKSHDTGEDIINTLFKHDMVFIYEDEELAKLGSELASLLKSTPKNKAKDNFADAFRYSVTKIPWDFSFISGPPGLKDETPEKPLNSMEQQIDARRKAFDDAERGDQLRIEAEFDEWNDAYGSDY